MQRRGSNNLIKFEFYILNVEYLRLNDNISFAEPLNGTMLIFSPCPDLLMCKMLAW